MKSGLYLLPLFTIPELGCSSTFLTADRILTKKVSAGHRWNQEIDDDFDRLNQLLENVSITIDDDMTVSQKIGFINLNLVVDNLTCRDISIGDIAIDHSTSDDDVTSTKIVVVDIALSGIEAACQVNYQYEFGLLNGSAELEIATNGNSASTSIEFLTNEENSDIIINSSVSDCAVDIEISDMNFIDPDFASSVVELFEPYLRNLIEKEIEKYACSQLSTTGVDFLNDDLFTMINDSLLILATIEGNVDASEISLKPNGQDVTQALNFQEISETQIGEFFKMALSQLDDLFGSKTDDEIGINHLLRSYILDENGVLVVNVADLLGEGVLNFELHDKVSRTVISLEEVRIRGLDSMTKFDPFIAIGDHTLRNEFSWKSLNMEIDLVLDMKPSSLEGAMLKLDVDSKQNGITEQITIKINSESVDFVASLFALINVEALGSLTVGSLLSLIENDDYSWVLPCLLSAIQELYLVELTMSSQQINAPTLEGFIDDGIDRTLSDVADIAFEIYSDSLMNNILPAVFRNTVRTFLNDLIGTTVKSGSNNSDACPTYNEIPVGDADYYVDFREFFRSPGMSTGDSEYGELPSMLREVLNTELLEENPLTEMPKINEVLIKTLTQGQSGKEGTLLFGGEGEDIFNVVQRINVGGFDANVRLSASDIKIENLDTVVSPLVLLEPVPTEPFFLNNSVTLGIEDRPMKLAATFAFAMMDNVEEAEISNKVQLSFDTHTVSVLATMMLKIVKSRLLGFPLIDVLDLNCWMATIPAPTLNEQGVSVENDTTATVIDFAASVASLNLSLNCVECSSPGIIELSQLLQLSDEAQTDVAFLVNTLLMSSTDMIKGDLLQVQIDRLLNDASKQCRHSPSYDPYYTIGGATKKTREYREFGPVEIEDSTTYLMLVGVMFVALIVVVALLVFSIRCFTRRRHNRWLSTLPVEQVAALRHEQRNDLSLEFALNSKTTSMFQSSEDIPCFVRWGMPFVILCNIALFISGHLNLGATVNIEATFAGESITVDKFFEFSMAKSTIDIWNAGGKELAILILIFSGIWPYTKQLISLALWFAPTSWVPISRRGSILLWLDWMAKWSMIDIFVLIICLAAFRVSVNSPSNLAFLPEGFYSLDLLVVPLWGLYANLIAQLVSQISSHFIIHYHRKVANRAHDSYMHSISALTTRANCDEKVLLRTHRFGRPHRGEEEKLIVKNWTNHILIFLVISLNTCIIAGCVIPSFSIEVFGLLGVAVESGQEFREAKTNHSVFTVIQLLFDQAQFLKTAKDYVGLGSFAVIFLSTVLLVPILQSIALLGHWFVPMTMKQRMRLTILVEILQAWQYAEVYLISIFVASWQLGPISSFMVNSYCGSLESFFSELVFYDILKNDDAQCFSIKSSIEQGFYILATGAILLLLTNAFLTKATKQYFRDRNQPHRRQIQEHGSTFECDEEGQEVFPNDSKTPIRPPPVLFTDTFRWFLKRESKPRKLPNASSCGEPSVQDHNFPDCRSEDS